MIPSAIEAIIMKIQQEGIDNKHDALRIAKSADFLHNFPEHRYSIIDSL